MEDGPRVPEDDALRGGARIDKNHYERLEAVFHEAVELTGDERKRYLDRACGDGTDLRRHVELLLSHDLEEDEETIVDRPGMGRELLASALDAEARKPPVVPQPETIDRYTIRERIAEGGMGVVYLAEQDHPRRQVALKVIRPGVFTEELLKRFEFEADLLGRLQHPGIARIYDAGEAVTEAGRQPWYAMEYIEGVLLTEYAEARNLSTDNRLRLLARICDAVHHAHQQGIVHRDLKPANLLVVEGDTPDDVTPSAGVVDPVGQPKVLDFGVSRLIGDQAAQITRLTQTGFVVGTVAYMSPEQASGDQGVDTRSDVYSLGVIGFELLAGRLPHEVREMPFVQALRTIQEKPAPHLSSVRTECRGDVSIIVGKALETDREQRYSSAAAMADDIRRYLTHQPITARPPTLGYQVSRFVRRHKAVVGAFGIAVLGLVIGLVFAIAAQREEARQRIVAEHRTEESRQSEYAALIQLAARYDAAGDRGSARRRLDATPPELRGWEWEYLSRSLEDELSYTRMSIASRPAPTLTADETRVLVMLEDGTRRLLDLAAGTSTECGPPGIEAVAHVPLDGGRTLLLAVPGIGVIRHRRGSGEEPETVLSTTRNLRFMVPSPGGGVLVPANGSQPTERGKLYELDSTTGTARLLTTQPLMITGAALSPDGRTLAVGLWQGMFRLLDVESGECLLEEEGAEHALHSITFSPGGGLVAGATAAHGILVWDVRTRRRMRVIESPRYEVTTLRFHGDDETLVSGHSNGWIRRWDVTTGECVWQSNGPGSEAAGDRSILRLAYPVDDGLVHAIAVDGVHVRPARPALADVLPHAPGAWPFTYDVEFGPTGRHLFSCGWDGAVRVWDVATREPVAVLPCEHYAHAARFSPDGRSLLIVGKHGYEDSVYSVRDATTLQTRKEVVFIFPYPQADWLPRSGAIVLGAGTDVRIVDPETLETRFTRPGPDDVHGLAVSPDGTLIACGRKDGTVTLLSADDLTLRRSFKLDVTWAEALEFSPDGRRLAAGGLGNTIQIFAVSTGREVLRFDVPEARQVFCFRFSPDGRRLFIGSRYPAVLIRDAATGRELLPLEGHTSYVHGLALSPETRILATASGDNTVRIWDARSLREKIGERDRMLAAETAVAPLVRSLLEDAGSVDAALEALVDEPGLDERQRHAARNVLLRRRGD